MNLELGAISDMRLAAGIIAESWAENNEAGLIYTPEYLEWLTSSPLRLPLSPSFYSGSDPVAFVIGVPRTFRVNGFSRSILLMSFFTVRAGYKGQALGRRIWAECLKQAATLGYDGALHYCVDGNISNNVTAAGAELAGYAMHRVFTVKYLNRLLRRSNATGATGGDPSVAEFQRAAALPDTVPLARTWREDEIEWMMRRPGGVTRTLPEGAAFSGYCLPTGADASSKTFLIDDILIEGLSESERDAAFRNFVDSAASMADMATVPDLGYVDAQTFARAGFRRSRRVLHAYLTLWSTPAPEIPLPAMYADVV